MNLEPLLNANWVILTHAIIALFALIAGAVQFLLEKGTKTHKLLGRIWVLMMAVVALSSFGIQEIQMFGPFSVIHLLSVLTLYSLWSGIWRIRVGDIAGHRRSMISLYIYAMLLTGSLTLMPGRIMNAVVFG